MVVWSLYLVRRLSLQDFENVTLLRAMESVELAQTISDFLIFCYVLELWY